MHTIIGQCSRLTIADLESLKNSMVLNGMILEDCDAAEHSDYFLQPGWDDEEAGEFQAGAGGVGEGGTSGHVCNVCNSINIWSALPREAGNGFSLEARALVLAEVRLITSFLFKVIIFS